MRSTLRWIAIAAVVAALAWAIVTPGTHGGPKVGGEAPDFTVAMLGGQDFKLSEHRGQVVVLDFWATWCGPCKMTLPALQEVREHYQNSTSVFVATVNTDRGDNRAAALQRWLDGRKLNFPVLLDDDRQTVSTIYDVRALPTLVVIGPDGKVSKVQVGVPAPTHAGIVEHIEEAIKDAQPERD